MEEFLLAKDHVICFKVYSHWLELRLEGTCTPALPSSESSIWKNIIS